MSEDIPTSDVAALTVQLLSAYLANNTVASTELAELIRSTRSALTEASAPDAGPVDADAYTPAVSVRKSLASSEHIISLIDGKRYKTLKRHLASHGLSPDTYRSRYNLPGTYPMVAPDYAAHRRAVAQKIGLGSRKRVPDVTEEADATVMAAPDAPRGDVPVAAKRKERNAPSSKRPDAAQQPAAASDDAAQPTQAQVEPTPSTRPDAVDNGAVAAVAPAAQKGGRRSAGTTKSKGSNAKDRASMAVEGSEERNEIAPAKGKPRRPRGKIGLFKKAGGEEAVSAIQGEPDTEHAGSEDETASSPAKPTARQRANKRMARTPKAQS